MERRRHERWRRDSLTGSHTFQIIFFIVEFYNENLQTK